MNLKKRVSSIAFATAITASVFATPVIDFDATTTTKSVTTEIKTMIQKLNLTNDNIPQETIKVKFMVNDNNELIVLSTNDSDIDTAIKSALNYKEVNSEGLKPYSVYVVPVTFEKK